MLDDGKSVCPAQLQMRLFSATHAYSFSHSNVETLQLVSLCIGMNPVWCNYLTENFIHFHWLLTRPKSHSECHKFIVFTSIRDLRHRKSQIVNTWVAAQESLHRKRSTKYYTRKLYWSWFLVPWNFLFWYVKQQRNAVI